MKHKIWGASFPRMIRVSARQRSGRDRPAVLSRRCLSCDTLCVDEPAVIVMTDRTSITLQGQTSATSPVYAHALSTEGVLDALKMLLIGAPPNDVLTRIALLIEAHTPAALCSVFLLDEDGVHFLWAAALRPG